MTETARSLALDLGTVRIGVALSDPLGLTAQPLPVLARIGPRKDVDSVAKLVREHSVRRIVIGLPLEMSGSEGEAAIAAREFADRLRNRLGGVEVDLWDERLTTVEAERTMIDAGVRRRRRRRAIDGLAAVLILQSYLDARGTYGPAADR